MPTPGNVSPPLRLLLQSLRATLGRDEQPRLDPVARPADWDEFDRLVERHAVGGWLHRALPAPLRTVFPDRTLHRWHAWSQTMARRALRHSATLVQLAKAFDAAGLPLLSVKGPLLAAQLYGGPGMRRAGDLDLLVRAGDVERAEELLRAAGGERSRPDFALTPRQTRAYRSCHYEFEYLLGPDRLRVELQWRLDNLPLAIDPWVGAVARPLGGVEILTPAPEANACYLFQHGARHGWYRLFWLIDVALLLRDESIDWAYVVAGARRWRIERPLLQGAALAAEWLGTPAPPAFALQPRERPTIRRLVREAQRQIAGDARAADRPVEWCRQLAYRVRLQRSVSARLAILRPHLVSVSSWKMVRLPDALFPLYHLLTPFLWLWRRSRR